MVSESIPASVEPCETCPNSLNCTAFGVLSKYLLPQQVQLLNEFDCDDICRIDTGQELLRGDTARSNR